MQEELNNKREHISFISRACAEYIKESLQLLECIVVSNMGIAASERGIKPNH